MRRYGLLLLLLAALGSLFGQGEDTAVRGAHLALEQADSCIRSEEYPAARALYLEALPYFAAEENYRQLSRIYLWLSETSYYAEDIGRAMEEVQYSRLLAESCLDPDTLPFYCTILQNQGLFHSVLSEFDEQMKCYLLSLDAALQYHGSNSARAADGYLSVGAAFGRRGRWGECIDYTEASLRIARPIGYREGIPPALLNLSYSYAEQEDVERAIQYQKQALAVATRQEEQARGLNNLGVYYVDIGEYGDALDHLHRALRLRRAASPPSESDIFSTLLNISRAHSEREWMDSARQYLELAIDGLRGKEDNRHLLQIAYNYKGKLLLAHGLPEAAEQAIRRGLSLRGAWRGVNSSSFMLLGETLLAQSRYGEALEAAQEGLRWAAPGFRADSLMANPPWETLESIAQARGLLKLKGDVLRESGLAQGNPSLLEASLSAFEQGDSLVMWLRNTYQSRLSRDQMAANANELYAGALHTLYHLYEQTGDTLYFDRALAYSEKNKALSVLENLNGLYARSFSGIPDAVVDAERQLLEEIEFYANLIKQNREHESPALLAKWDSLIFRKRRQQDSLLSHIKDNFPRYYQMKHGFQLAKVKPLQEELLAPGETLLEFFRDADSLFVLLLSGHQRLFFHLPAPQLEEKVEAFYQSVVERGPAFYERSHELYRLLFEPLEPYIDGQKIAIVPDNILAHLPFELLLSEPVASVDEPHARHAYLLKDYSIRILFSANAALQAQHNKATGPVRRKILAMAPSFEGEENGGRASLPGARRELKALKGRYQGLFLEGEAASEANFRKNSHRYGVYHIATHAQMNRHLSSAAYLVLEGGNGHDGRLYVHELYTLRLNAELAVLSACNTGMGPIKVGEGSASLAHAFAYAGCSDLVMALWPVRDQATPVLAEQYYDNMAEGMGRCEALRQAKLYCLEYDELFAHPYFWGGFIYAGSRQPLALERRTGLPRWLFVVLLVLLAAGVTFAVMRRGRR